MTEAERLLREAKLAGRNRARSGTLPGDDDAGDGGVA